MEPNGIGRPGVTRDGSSSGLEGHLRNLILTSGNRPSDLVPSVTSENSHTQTLTVGSTDSNLPPRFQASTSSRLAGPITQPSRWSEQGEQTRDEDKSDFTRQQGLQLSRGNRRRPNQAQRRQMSSQYSIPIDTRHQPSPYAKKESTSHAGVGINNHPSPHQRHHYSNSYPHGAFESRHSESPRDHSLWRDSSQNSATKNTHWHPPMSPHGQYSAVGFQPIPPVPHIPNHSQGMPHNQSRPYLRTEDIVNQANVLDELCYQVVSSSEIDRSEIGEKESFRQRIESICRDVITKHEVKLDASRNFPSASVELKCFGSLSSGFATKASDMDLGLLSPLSLVQPEMPTSPIPRLLEKAFLDAGLGARLLSRTRVPIIKLCEKPTKDLLQGLVAEREKWDCGSRNEGHDEHDDDFASADRETDEQHKSDEQKPTTSGVAASSLSTEFEVSYGTLTETRRVQLKQGVNHSISAYYGLAKRILRRAGGQDVMASNCHQLNDTDWTLLNSICHGFVLGLSDSNLRERLMQYPSLSPDASIKVPNFRSLHSVFIQAEGEQMIMAWDVWTATKLIHAPHPQIEPTLRAWHDLQWKQTFGASPAVSYTKELQLALDRIKRLPWFQLLTLEQGQYETPSQYHLRTNGIINSLKLSYSDRAKILQHVVPDCYLSGIYCPETQAAVKSAVDKSPEVFDLNAISRRHKSLHLALELDKAVEKGLYGEAHIEDIQKYIALLRSPLRKIEKNGSVFEFALLLSPESSALVSRIKTLQDPHKIIPGHPRDRYRDQLEFPKTGAGVQCDINFSAHLALQNTLLLRCYSHTDPRVRPMVLFVKHWAKVRGINSGYRGTLSSYGYVLMVIHYLVNICQPFVCPNLQQLAPQQIFNPTTTEIETTIQCKGYNIQFWRNEGEILELSRRNQLNHNTDKIGFLLRGFFEYYAQNGFLSQGSGKGFDWGRDVLSLRTQGGLLTKQEKGWTGAKTVFEVQGTGSTGETQPPQRNVSSSMGLNPDAAEDDNPTQQAKPVTKGGDVKEIRHRYLFAVEDPFELDHNVARTVTHNGIVSIRDEFRRAWRLIRSTGNTGAEKNLLQDTYQADETSNSWLELLDDLHGRVEASRR